MSQHFASRQLREALRTRNGPTVTEIHKSPIGSPVLVYRPEKDKREAPYSLLDISGDDIIILTTKGAQIFCSTVVKPYVSEKEVIDTSNPTINNTQMNVASSLYQKQPHSIGNRFLMTLNGNHFENSQMAEFNGLLDRSVSKLVPGSEAAGLRIYGSRFVDTIKHEETPQACEKSRLVVQAYNDSGHGLLTHTPTVLRVSQRLLLTQSAMDTKLKFFTRDISQAYVQSETSTQRRIYVRSPKDLKLPADILLRVYCPLYGIPEAGLHWFRRYHDHHKEKLFVIPATHDPCFLYTKHGMSTCPTQANKLRGFTCLQTDDTASARSASFLDREQKMSSRFDCKPKKVLNSGESATFNGARISLEGNIYSISQPKHIIKVQTFAEEQVDKADFVAQHARGAYIAAVGRPDLTYGFAFASQIVHPDTSSTKALNKHISRAKASASVSLRFVPMDAKSARLAVFSDASFASNPDLTYVLGYVLLLADDHGNANILHYSSVKSKRITRSVLAAELFAAVHAFDFASTLRTTINDLFHNVMPLVLYTASKSLFDSVVGLNSTAEKRLLIDLCLLHQSYELRKLSEIVRMPSAQNPANAMTNLNAFDALKMVINTNNVSVDAKIWIDRPASKLAKSVRLAKTPGDTVLPQLLPSLRVSHDVGLVPSWTPMPPSLASHYRADRPSIHLPVVNHEKHIL